MDGSRNEASKAPRPTAAAPFSVSSRKVAAPRPFPPDPDNPALEPTEGGGGTTLLASCVPLSEAPEFPVPLEPRPEAPTDGGGGITLDAPRVDP